MIAAACRAGGRADPTKTPLVTDTLRGIARQHALQPGAAPRQARALTCEAPATRGARVDAAVVTLLFLRGPAARRRPRRSSGADIEPTERPGRSASGSGPLKANPTAERDDFRLLVGPFVRALEELRGAVRPRRVIPRSPYQVNQRILV